MEGGACAFVQYDKKGVALCGIELAWLKGETPWRKPVSCHLYPVRVKDLGDHEALNYEEWDICNPACKNGEKIGIPVYRFVKDALIRKYGEEFYNALEAADDYRSESAKKD
jgi:hypothetical protein